VSLLKKLFSKKEQAPSSPRAPVDRAPRLRSTVLRDVSFRLENGAELPIVNLSRSGLALERGSLAAWPEIKSLLKGSLQVKQLTFSVQIQLMNTRDLIAGFRFDSPEAALSAALDEHFRIEFSALRMTKIDPKALKEQPDGEPQWFRGADTSELYIVCRGAEVLSFVLSFLDYRVEYSGTKTPKVMRRIGKGGPKRAYEETSYEVVPQTAELTELVTRFLAGIESLPKEHHEALLLILANAKVS
jgi:hypothetical protein